MHVEMYMLFPARVPKPFLLLAPAHCGLWTRETRMLNGRSTVTAFWEVLGFIQLIFVPQLFYISSANGLKILAVKVADDILLAAPIQMLRSFVVEMKKK